MPPPSMSLRAWPRDGQRPDLNEQVDQGGPGAFDLCLLKRLGGDLSSDVAKKLLGDAVQAPAKHDLACPDGVIASRLPVHEDGHLTGKCFVGLPGGRVGDCALRLAPRSRRAESSVNFLRYAATMLSSVLMKNW